MNKHSSGALRGLLSYITARLGDALGWVNCKMVINFPRLDTPAEVGCLLVTNAILDLSFLR